MANRDERYRNRQKTPLKVADEAMLLDTSELGRDAAVAEAIRLVERHLKSHRGLRVDAAGEQDGIAIAAISGLQSDALRRGRDPLSSPGYPNASS